MKLFHFRKKLVKIQSNAFRGSIGMKVLDAILLKLKRFFDQVVDANLCRYYILIYVGLLFLVLTSNAFAATYYVDYAQGNDTNNGTSTSAPFRHCPGDPNATDSAASIILSPGDVVIFKRGVTYQGTIICEQDGAQVASGSKGAITATGVLTDADAPFASVTSDHYTYIYHSKESVTNTWVESCGLWKVASKDTNSQINISGYDGIAHPTA